MLGKASSRKGLSGECRHTALLSRSAMALSLSALFRGDSGPRRLHVSRPRRRCLSCVVAAAAWCAAASAPAHAGQAPSAGAAPAVAIASPGTPTEGVDSGAAASADPAKGAAPATRAEAEASDAGAHEAEGSAAAVRAAARGSQPAVSREPAADADDEAAHGSRVSREELGNATWLLLHTMAAQWPDSPTRAQRRSALEFVRGLSVAYPCAVCGAHFRALLKEIPPRVGSGGDFRAWACEAHNRVNEQLGKPRFNCARLAARWGGIDCGTKDQGGGGDACSLEAPEAAASDRGAKDGKRRGGDKLTL